MSLSLATILLSLSASVSIETNNEVLEASFKLDEAVSSYQFAPYDSPQRTESWKLLSEDWNFDGQTIRRNDGQSFSKFSLEISPDKKFVDRRFVATSRVGAGWALYLGAFVAVDSDTEISFSNFMEDAVLNLPLNKTGINDSFKIGDRENRVAYIGPANNISIGDVSLIAGEEMPIWMKKLFVQEAEKVIKTLEARFGVGTKHLPTIILNYMPGETAWGYKGGTMDGGTIKLNFDRSINNVSSGQTQEFQNFIAHELVHLWLNDVWDTKENNEQPWLHEGAAEYIADRITLEGDAFQIKAARHINDCIKGLKDKPLDGSAGRLYGKIPYDCGFTLHLVAELGGLKNNSGDVLDLWKSVVESTEDGQYDSVHFLKVTKQYSGELFNEFIATLLFTQGALKNLKLGKILADYGVDVTTSGPTISQQHELIRFALHGILGPRCNGGYGWNSYADHLRLDTGERCGEELKNSPSVDTVNGKSLVADAYNAFLSITEACKLGEDLVFGIYDKDEFLPALECSHPIRIPEKFSVLAPLPALPSLKR